MMVSNSIKQVLLPAVFLLGFIASHHLCGDVSSCGHSFASEVPPGANFVHILSSIDTTTVRETKLVPSVARLPD